MPTLKDIAERVGVSISTVSRVLANESNRSVNSQTKQKIWDVARDLGYPIKSSAQEPASAVKGIGCIVSTMQDRYYHPYFSVILDGIDKELTRNGYKIAFTRTQEDLKRPEILREVTEDPQIEGIILIEGIDKQIYDHIKKTHQTYRRYRCVRPGHSNDLLRPG